MDTLSDVRCNVKEWQAMKNDGGSYVKTFQKLSEQRTLLKHCGANQYFSNIPVKWDKELISKWLTEYIEMLGISRSLLKWYGLSPLFTIK